MTAPLVLALALQLGTPSTTPRPAFCLRVDSVRHEVVVTAGPFRVRAEARDHMAMMDSGSRTEQSDEVFVERFPWPTTALVRGYRLRVFDSGGSPLPRRLMHHLYLVDFDRRDLVYPVAQRVFGLGGETPDLVLGSSVGIPLPAGHDLGLYLMWHNDTGADLDGVRFELAFRLVVPEPRAPPLAVFPFFVDAHVALGADWTFAIPPGGGNATYEFTLPISGRLRAAGAHLHDHGLSVQLEDAVTGETIVTLNAHRDSAGRLLGMPYRVLTVHDSGPHLVAGRRYRLVATYDNPTSRPLTGVMGTLGGVFAPDDAARWPRIDPADPSFALDRDLLTTSHPHGGPQAELGRTLADGRCAAVLPTRSTRSP